MQQTETATSAYVRHHMTILATLDEIAEMVEDKPVPDFAGFTPNWGHVGDLATLAANLAEIRDRLANNEV